jgi:hypothetical protein
MLSQSYFENNLGEELINSLKDLCVRYLNISCPQLCKDQKDELFESALFVFLKFNQQGRVKNRKTLFLQILKSRILRLVQPTKIKFNTKINLIPVLKGLLDLFCSQSIAHLNSRINHFEVSIIYLYFFYLLPFLHKCGYIEFPTCFLLKRRLYGNYINPSSSRSDFSSRTVWVTASRIEKESPREISQKRFRITTESHKKD